MRQRVRKAAAALGALMVFGTAAAAEPVRHDHVAGRTLAEVKRSMDQMPVTKSSAEAIAVDSTPRSLNEAKRALAATATSTSPTASVPLSGEPLVKAKRL